MKKLSGLVAALAVLLPGAALAQSQEYYEGSYTRLSYIQGDVYIQRAQDQGYEKGELNLVAVQGDKIGTRVGKLEVQLGRRNYLRLADGTVVELAGLPVRDGDVTKLHLLQGSLFLRVNTMDREKAIELHTPDASFYVLDRGLYRLDVRQNRETELSVLEGQAEAAGETGSTLIEAGRSILASGGKFASGPQALMARNDAFSEWNSTREALYARQSSTSYLPAEYADYENELNDNGRWVYEEDYGNVWVPTVSYSDWRPYYWGRWVWYPIIGWTWVSYDSWGWCTHHYGRWGWRHGLGWYWMPHRDWSWGPAWVHWYWDNDYIGWCPLSYWGYPGVIINDVFYGRHNRYDFRDYARSMTVVGRHQLQDRRLDRLALGSDRLQARGGRIDLRNAQPDVRAVRTDGRLAGEASRVLSGSQMRQVDRSFDGRGLRVGSQDLRAPASRRSVSEGAAVLGGAGIRDRSTDGASISSRRIEGGLSSSGSVRSGNTASSRGISGETRSLSGSGDRAIRVYPRTRDDGSGTAISGRSSSTSSRSISSRSRLLDSNTPPSFRDETSIRRYEGGSVSSGGSSGSSGSSRVRDYESSSSLSGRASARSNDDGAFTGDRRSIREYSGGSDAQGTRSVSGSRGLSVNGRESSDSNATIRRDESSRGSSSSSGGGIRVNRSRDSEPSARNYSSSLRNAPSTFREYSSSSRISGSSARLTGSQSFNSAPRSYSASSRSSSSSSFGGSSRSYSSPSRSYSSSSRSSSSSFSAPRSYSAPSRSYSSSSRSSSSSNFGSSSRSYSSPSRSYSSSSRSSSSSFSAPRSYSAPSRSYSSPSRSSSSSSSRSYSSPSRSSGSFSRSSSSSSRGSSSSSRSSSSGRSSGGSSRRR